MRQPQSSPAQAQLQLARARLMRSGTRVKEAVEARLDVGGAVQRRAWALLALAFAVGFWVGHGRAGQHGGRDHAGD